MKKFLVYVPSICAGVSIKGIVIILNKQHYLICQFIHYTYMLSTLFSIFLRYPYIQVHFVADCTVLLLCTICQPPRPHRSVKSVHAILIHIHTDLL